MKILETKSKQIKNVDEIKYNEQHQYEHLA